MFSMYLKLPIGVPRNFHGRFIAVLILNPIYIYCLYICFQQRCPQTLSKIFRIMGLCDVLRAVAAGEYINPGFITRLSLLFVNFAQM